MLTDKVHAVWLITPSFSPTWYQYLTLSTLESTSNPKYYDREPVNRLLSKNMDDRLAQISKSGRYGTGQVVAIQCHVSKLRQTPDSDKLPIVDGIGPWNWFLCNVKCVSSVKRLIVMGMVPVNVLLSKPKYTSCVNHPISEGIVFPKIFVFVKIVGWHCVKSNSDKSSTSPSLNESSHPSHM